MKHLNIRKKLCARYKLYFFLTGEQDTLDLRVSVYNIVGQSHMMRKDTKTLSE